MSGPTGWRGGCSVATGRCRRPGGTGDPALSVQGLTAIWAVAKTGAGYVAVDPDYPADRVAHMIDSPQSWG